MGRTRQPGRTRRRLARWLDPTIAAALSAPSAPPVPAAPPQSAESRPTEVPAAEPQRWPHVLEQISLRILSAVYQAADQVESIEGDEQDSERLDRLYRIDHAVTRVRRQAENMQVLAGRQVEDADRQVTSLVDVVRAAVSAIEQYRRVQVGRVVELAVVEFAADDVMRVLTELLDNATRFSPPSSSVVVSAHLTEQASVLFRIEDEGLGIRPEELPRWNAVLSGAAALPTDRGIQLGLAVVSRLAANHRMRVQLVPHRDAGTTATVLVPAGLLCEIPDPDAPPSHRRPVPRPRHAAPEPQPQPWEGPADPPPPPAGGPAGPLPQPRRLVPVGDAGPAPRPPEQPRPEEPRPLPVRTPASLRGDDTVVMPVIGAEPPPASDQRPWYEDIAAFAAGTAEATQPADQQYER